MSSLFWTDVVPGEDAVLSNIAYALEAASFEPQELRVAWAEWIRTLTSLNEDVYTNVSKEADP
ncbi:hypothetical protein GCM10017322_39730 [Paracoccus aerius]|nr:hypothetical protein GCM10017322_39730 [Paracoccus aerius]